MASNFSKEGQVQLRPRKGHDTTWSCDKHGDPIKFYCNNHVMAICHPCATKDHVKRQCDLVDIEDIILELERKLQDKFHEIEEAKERLKRIKSDISSSETSARDHFKSLNDEASVAYDVELKNVNDKARDDISFINKEADDEIRMINEKREGRIKACNAEAEQQRQFVKESRRRVTADAQTVRDAAVKLIKELRDKVEHTMSQLDIMDNRMKSIRQTDEGLVTRGPQALKALNETLGTNDPSSITQCLDQIDREVQKVRFVKGKIGGELYSRIDGYSGKWELAKSLDIPSMINDPWVCGSVSEDEICVRDMLTNHLYVTNLRSRHTEKVLDGDSGNGVSSCTALNRIHIVCGKWKKDCSGDTINGCITIYDRQWKVVQDIAIPRNAPGPDKPVYVDVDPDGMILAAQRGQSNVYVINPADGGIVGSFTIPAKVGWCAFKAMSSGGIVLKGDADTADPDTHPKEVAIISRYGLKKTRIGSEKWYNAECSLDRLTDTIYNLHRTVKEIHDATWGVDLVSSDGRILAKMIVEYVHSYRANFISPCVVTPSGMLVICNGDKFLMYKKSFAV